MAITKTEKEYLQALVNIGGLAGASRATKVDEKTIRNMLKDHRVRHDARWKLKTFIDELITVEG